MEKESGRQSVVGYSSFPVKERGLTGLVLGCVKIDQCHTGDCRLGGGRKDLGPLYSFVCRSGSSVLTYLSVSLYVIHYRGAEEAATEVTPGVRIPA